jgi:hypothetical protein
MGLYSLRRRGRENHVTGVKVLSDSAQSIASERCITVSSARIQAIHVSGGNTA